MVDKRQAQAYNSKVKRKNGVERVNAPKTAVNREDAALLQGIRRGQGSAAPELPIKSDVCAALMRGKAAGVCLQSGWYHGSYTAFAPVPDGIVSVGRGGAVFCFPFASVAAARKHVSAVYLKNSLDIS